MQLSEETKANKKGFYDIFKEHLPKSLSNSVEWKTNDGGRIKVRDIIALCWVALSKLELPDGIHVNPNQIYRNKAVCVASFNKLLEHKDISSPAAGGYAYNLHNQAVKSAMQITGDLPKLYDMLTKEIPNAYNKSGGSFGKISAVRIFDAGKAADKNPKYLRSQPATAFYQSPIDYTCPDGFIVPLLYGFRALLTVDKNGTLAWKTDPQVFLRKHLVEIMKSYRLVIEMAGWDPQKVGKNISAYQFAESTIAAIYSVKGEKAVA